MQADSKYPEAHNFKGTLLSLAGQPDAALKAFEEALRLRPDFGQAHLNAAAILASQRDFNAARAHLEQAAGDKDPNIR